MSTNDYELLNILDKNTNSKIFKVRHKNTGEYFVWYKIDSENLGQQQLKHLEGNFLVRKSLQHPNLVEFVDFIKEETGLCYLVVKYYKYGSLKYLMDLVFNDNKRFSEEFLCKILYQIALVVKTVNLSTYIDIKDVYFDENYNVKVLNFRIHVDDIKFKSPKISSLGTVIFEVCTLTKFGKKSFEKELKSYNYLYSKEFISLILAMLKDGRDLKKHVDKVMCNSTVLLKVTQWNKQKCFIKIDDRNCASQNNEKVEDLYALHFEKLKEKEIILQQKENMLLDKEHKLAIKEKNIALLEKQLQERLEEGTCNCFKVDQKVPIKENLDSTYISCIDSVIQTSKKLNVNEIIKPPTFTRTLSEKRIRFKGHSPLKDIDFNRRRSVRPTKAQKDIGRRSSDWITCSDDTDKSTLVYKKRITRSKQLFHTYENPADTTDNGNVPKTWTEENKKHAFELLRLMNNGKENKPPPDIKHTFL